MRLYFSMQLLQTHRQNYVGQIRRAYIKVIGSRSRSQQCPVQAVTFECLQLGYDKMYQEANSNYRVMHIAMSGNRLLCLRSVTCRDNAYIIFKPSKVGQSDLFSLCGYGLITAILQD